MILNVKEIFMVTFSHMYYPFQGLRAKVNFIY